MAGSSRRARSTKSSPPPASSRVVVRGPELAQLPEELNGKPGVDQIAPFGATLHVVGKDRVLLATTLAPIAKRKGYSVTPGATSLEDVFIQLMARAEDNMP